MAFTRKALRADEPSRQDPASWFTDRGLVSMLEGTGLKRTGSRGMAIPLGLAYLFAILPFLNDRPWNGAIDFAYAIGNLLVILVLTNLVRRRRPLAIPDVIGLPEVAFFVIIPTLSALVIAVLDSRSSEFGVPLWHALTGATVVQAGFQLAILFVVWLLMRSGIVTLMYWLVRQVAGSMDMVGVALARTVPLLLGVVGMLALTAEVWQSLGRITTIPYTSVIVLFIVVSGLFLSSRWQFDLDVLSRFESREAVNAALTTADLHISEGADMPTECPLTPKHRRKLRLVAAMSRLSVASIVASSVFVFFLAFAFLAVDLASVKSWAQADPRVLFTWNLASHEFALTWEHLKVSGFLAVFTGFYFSVVSATDASLREGMRDTAEDLVREACAARLVLLARQPSTGDGQES